MENSESRKKKVNKKFLIIAVFLAVIIGGSSLFAVSVSNNPAQPVNTPSKLLDVTPPNKSIYDSATGQFNITKFVENELSSIPNECYVIYENSTNKSDNSTILYFYNSLVQNVLKTPYVGNSSTVFLKFMHMPQVELYFYDHCKFLDSKTNPVPQKYDPYQGRYMDSQEQKNMMYTIKTGILSKYDFVKVANKTRSIQDLGAFYFMNAKEVVNKMFETGVISLDHDCRKGGFDASSTVYNCSWKNDYFEYETTTHTVYPVNAPPRENPPPNQRP